jgi:hypothetical protein
MQTPGLIEALQIPGVRGREKSGKLSAVCAGQQDSGGGLTP